MITYVPGHWGVAMIFQLKGSVFPKAMVWAVPLTIFAGILHYILHQNKGLIELVGIGTAATSVFGGFTFILGFLVVFRSQQAYSRWWEGGTLLLQLRGEWFNSYSCLMAFSNQGAPEKSEEVWRFQQQLVRLFSLLYCSALAQVSQMDVNSFEVLNVDGMDPETLKFLQTCPDKCEMCLQWIQRLMVEAEQKGWIKIAPPILSRVYNELGNGIVNLNNARKIKEFLIPFPIAQMVMVMLMFHALFTPLVCATTIKPAIWATFLTFIVTFSYWSILYIALELEMPFGDDPNDLPMRAMSADMNSSLSQMLEPHALKTPGFNYIEESCITATRGWRGEVDVDGEAMYVCALSEEVRQALPQEDIDLYEQNIGLTPKQMRRKSQGNVEAKQSQKAKHSLNANVAYEHLDYRPPTSVAPSAEKAVVRELASETAPMPAAPPSALPPREAAPHPPPKAPDPQPPEGAPAATAAADKDKLAKVTSASPPESIVRVSDLPVSPPDLCGRPPDAATSLELGTVEPPPHRGLPNIPDAGQIP